MNGPQIEIIDTIPSHIRSMVECMKEQLKTTAFMLGISPQKALWKSYKQSIFSKTAFINGEIAAIWGCAGDVVGEKGIPWLICSPAVEDYPFRVMFVFRQELNNMLRMFSILEDFVDESDEKVKRMLKITGFIIGDKVHDYHGIKLRRATKVV